MFSEMRQAGKGKDDFGVFVEAGRRERRDILPQDPALLLFVGLAKIEESSGPRQAGLFLELALQNNQYHNQ